MGRNLASAAEGIVAIAGSTAVTIATRRVMLAARGRSGKLVAGS